MQELMKKPPVNKTKFFSCEKASTCEDASPNCFELICSEHMICTPNRRWMYCYAWKKKLGMVFDKELGIYILPEWREELLKRAKQ